MSKKIITIVAACAMALSLTACGGNTNDSGSGSSTASDSSAADTDSGSPSMDSGSSVVEELPEPEDGIHYDLDVVYNAIIENMGDLAGSVALEKVSSDAEIGKLYHGLDHVQVREKALYTSTEKGQPYEIMLMELQTETDAMMAQEIILDRIDNGAADKDDDIASKWINDAAVQQSGRFVAMILLPKEYDPPFDVFMLAEE